MKLIDNLNHRFGDDIKENLHAGSKLQIAASFFSIYAYAALKQELKNIDGMQFLFTSPTFVANDVTDKFKKEKREFVIPQLNREDSLYGTEFEIHLRNKLTQKAIAKECAEWIRNKAVFKSNTTNAPMQEFVCVKDKTSLLTYMPIQGFTPVGLGYEKGDAVSNMVNRFDSDYALPYLNLFNQIWQDQQKVTDITDEIVRHIESVYQENDPERIYFLILYNIFKEFLEDLNEDVMPNDLTGYHDTLIWQKLYNFQTDAAVGIINKLETYNGCILADSVGLGKTFTALAVVKYYELRNKSVLVLCPKKLGANWTNYNANLTTNIFAKDRFNYDVLFHTDLSRNSGETLGIDLAKINWGNYDLVVIDESHNFRNRDNFKDKKTRYDRLMEQVIQQGVKTKVLMLSATPVNNRFNDLKNQLALAYEGDSKNLDDKLDTKRDIDTIFRNAQASFNNWSKLPVENRTTKAILDMLDFDFFKLLDSVTIARSRKHIQRFYDTKEVGQFPTRLRPLSYRCSITADESITFNQIYKELASIRMVVYAPLTYIFPSALEKYEDLYDTEVEGKGRFKQQDREKSLQALMTVNLLKRLESSVHAFRLTLHNLKNRLEQALSSIAEYQARKSNDLLSIDIGTGYDDDAYDEGLDGPTSPNDWVGGKLKVHLDDMDILKWHTDLEADYAVVRRLISTISTVTPERDHKLQHLKKHLIDKINNPINPGNQKVLIFTAFADTANYLYEHIAPELLHDFSLHTAKITGSENHTTIKSMVSSRKGYDMQGLLTLFSPRSKQKNDIFPDETREIDILIATDCISEGQNLQDCDYLINYDIHWNPVRIIQRFGRIDRIGSTNDQIQLVNYWPDISLDEYINLRERVENRMVIVDMSSTGDDNVLSSKANDIAYRHEQLKRMQTEVLDLEDANTGVSITDLGLNDFRMDLLSYIEANPNLKRLPNGLHAVVPANDRLGLPAGVIFALKARELAQVSGRTNNKTDGEKTNQLYPYYLMYIDNDGNIIADYTQAKHLLSSARQACRGQPEPILAVCETFNQRTADGQDMSHYSLLLDLTIEAIKNVKADKDIDSLFSGMTTTALKNDIQELNDFELIGFVVVEELTSDNTQHTSIASDL
ncbi:MULTISPECIES: helicase-related protein [Psychrobacter]|uniref:helicase-related protein n=1 Tax=Psychrobacter TaxID=497 RepID=UPI00191A05C3|nr:helicase-related protein [Psychrobacter immobilis]